MGDWGGKKRFKMDVTVDYGEHEDAEEVLHACMDSEDLKEGDEVFGENNDADRKKSADINTRLDMITRATKKRKRKES